MVRIERLQAGHADEVLRFELENRAYFARFISDRGDAYFAEFGQRHQWLLDLQEAGVDHLHVILDGDRVVGRINLVEVDDGSAELGYRIAEASAGRGLATWAVREICDRARTEYGLSQLTAMTTTGNVASQKILERTGFVRTGDVEINGEPGYGYVRRLDT
ncbi:ribosomal-protein-alanine N-acetyltransferase [Kribbella amoyensis]|uniref:Ribosomal-protein-alanine N-acetyltransferase n=1 Tax=Kribbella amoyensis TaxID=996641 RepID=A0A561BQX7_9ACTN|nr:GNAT family N-acetyltransferase [Kribbella amoyensis]TWD81212.1 ribosomal-protein-alanine N-acetyltransferase [Kribbella amoyensis]